MVAGEAVFATVEGELVIAVEFAAVAAVDLFVSFAVEF